MTKNFESWCNQKFWPIKGALEFSIRFTGQLWATTTDFLSAGRWTSPWVVLTFNTLVSRAPNVPVLRFQWRAPLTNYSYKKYPLPLKNCGFNQIHIIKETLCSPKAKKKKKKTEEQNKMYLTSLKLYVYFCQHWKKTEGCTAQIQLNPRLQQHFHRNQWSAFPSL